MSDQNTTTFFRNIFGGEWQGYNANAARALGGIGTAIFTAYVIRWQLRDHYGWCWRTEQQIEQDTALSRKQLARLRDELRKRGLLAEQRRGNPARMYYQINLDLLHEILSVDQQVVTKGHNLSGPKGTTSCDQRGQLYSYTDEIPINDKGVSNENTTSAGADQLTKSRQRLSVFEAYATACAFKTATERNRQHTAAAADLTQLQTDGDLPEPDLMRMATEYVIRVWRSAGITRRPSFAQVVDALTEFTEWQTAWNRAVMPLDPQGNPDYMLLRRQVEPKPTAPTKTNVIRNVWAEKVREAEAMPDSVIEGEYR